MALVTTIYGDMEEELLVKEVLYESYPNVEVTITRYTLNGEEVHRSPHIKILKWPDAAIEQGVLKNG
jgi:hypothetical protein